MMWGCNQPFTEQLQTILMLEKKLKKIENFSELEPMTLALRGTSPVSASWLLVFTKEKPVSVSYKDMEQLGFQILFT